MMRSVNELQGYTVLATNGQIGKVDEFYFDDKGWILRYLVVDTGDWLPGRRVLISPQALSQPNVKTPMLLVTLTREQLENSPEVDTDKPVSRQYEVELHQYYGWPIYWGDHGAPLSSADVGVYPGAVGKTNQAPPGDPHLRSTKEVTGYHIQARDGEIGHMEDFIISDETWKIQYMVVDTRNWLPGKKVLLALDWIERVSWPEAKVFVTLARETIKNSPEYDPLALVNRQDSEEAFYEQYGWPRHRA